MEVKRSTRLPEGVGKKIVEALKKQSESAVENQTQTQTPFDESFDSVIEYDQQDETSTTYKTDETEDTDWNSPQSSSYEETYVTQKSELEDDFSLDTKNENDDFQSYQEDAYDESDFESFEYYESQDSESEPKIEDEEEMIQENVYTQPVPNEESHQYETYTQPQYNTETSYVTPAYEIQPEKESFIRQTKQEKLVMKKQDAITPLQLELSTNVDVLMRLISQLPPGVTRQTGAQIIRQTMEAMGVSMNKVLGEAQQAQDELGHSIRDNMNTIEEYRNNIRILEKEVQKYRKKSDELEDLISLFILSEKDNQK